MTEMIAMALFEKIIAREIFDSRGNPTVEVDLTLDDSSFGRASVPSGASTGAYEAVELRDGDSRLGGLGVKKACSNVNTITTKAVIGHEANQAIIDQKMIDLDGTENKSKLGANAILGVSLALAKATAVSNKQALWEYFRSLSSHLSSPFVMPVPMMNILNGGKHADKSTDIQEFMIIPISAQSFRQAIEMGVNVFHALKRRLAQQGFSTTVGDEGGFGPSLKNNQAALDEIMQAITEAGFKPGEDIALAIDVAASELYHDGSYRLDSENVTLSTDELIEQYEAWVQNYPILSIEDPLHENDWDGYCRLTEKMGKRIQIVGDDLFVTNVKRLEQGIKTKAGNAILIKLNQIGSVTETIDAIELATTHNFKSIVSHRSGETEDTTIADFVVGLSTGQIKTGSLSRTDRVAKYNQLLRIEEALGSQATYPGRTAFNKN
jgi:enolase